MAVKIFTALELEALGIPYSQEPVVDWYYTGEGTAMLIFKLEDKYYGVEVFEVDETDSELHWWACYEDENRIVAQEMKPQEITSIRYFPVGDSDTSK